MAIYNREDPRTVLPQLEKQIESLKSELASLLEPKSISADVSSTTGTITVMGSYKSGQTIQLVLKCSNSSAVDGGTNIATGTLANYMPAYYVMGSGYYGSRSIMCNVNESGNIIVRNASTTQLAANSEAWCSITYITKEK